MPWTDEQGDQQEFAEAGRQWRAFHKKLPNSSKTVTVNQGIVVQSHLYGHAQNICKSIPESTINIKDGVDATVNAVHQRDPLMVVSTVYYELIRLMFTRQIANESFHDFESRFSAQMSRFNYFASYTLIYGPMSALMLLVNAKIDLSQLVSILLRRHPLQMLSSILKVWMICSNLFIMMRGLL